MGYNMKTWNSPIKLDANNLNRIELGIKNSHDALEIVSEEVSNLQTKQFDILKDIKALTTNAPNILSTLKDLQEILNTNDMSTILNNVDSFLTKSSQTLSASELDQVYKNLKLNTFLKLTDIKVNNSSIVKGSEVNITLPTVDTLLNINSVNAVANKTITKALNDIKKSIENINIDIEVPTKLSQLDQDLNHLLVTYIERDRWNSYKDIFLSKEDFNNSTRVPEHNHDENYSIINHTHPEIIAAIPAVPTNLSEFINDVPYATEDFVKTNGGKIDKILINNEEIGINNKIVNILIPTDLKDFTNSPGYLTKYTETDPTVPDWAKEESKPEYYYSEILYTPKNLTDFKNDANFISREDTLSLLDTSSKDLKQYTDQAIASLVNGAPDTLNTLDELAEALKDNKDIVKVLEDAIATKANTSDLDNYLPLTAGSGKPLTGTLYANKGVTVNSSAISANNTEGIVFAGTDDKTFIGAGTSSLGIYSKGSMYLRPGTETDTAAGVKITRTDISPTTSGSMSLGTSTNKYNNIYGTTIYQDGKQVANAEDLAKYIPQGGTLTAPLTVTGGDTATAGKIILDQNNKGQITNTSTQTLLGFTNSTTLAVGHSSYLLALRGSGTRPKFNSKDIALVSDALPNFTINISHQSAGNPRLVKFVSVNYASVATCFKMAAMTCHDNGVSYQFLTDMLIAVTTAGEVTANIYKFAQSSIGNVDGVARYTGDVFYVNDTTNKIVDFYILCGQWSDSQFTPVTKVGSTSIANVTQYSGTANYYSSGTKTWVNGCGTTYAKLSDIPTNYVNLSSNQTVGGTKTFSNAIIAPQFKSDSTEAGMYFGSSNELDFGSNGNTLYIGYANKLGTTGAVSQWWFGRSNGSAGWRSGDIHCGSVNIFSTSTNKSWNASQNPNGDLVFTFV
jgi:hypothetical protein